jgi:transcriptional regulator with XRE-family HTH domain
MSIGPLLKQAREQAGLSAAQISERTRIQLYKIDALENGNFFLLPDGVYLDGIVRAYARELSLESEPLIERLHRERPPFTLDSVAILKDIHASRKRKGRGREPWKHIAIARPQATACRPRSRRPLSQGLQLLSPLLLLLDDMGGGIYLYETTRLPNDQTLAI